MELIRIVDGLQFWFSTRLGAHFCRLHFIVYVIFAKCAKRNRSPRSPPARRKKKKTKKLKRNFECLYLANGCCEFNQIFCVAYPTWGTAIMQNGVLWRRGHGGMHT